MQTISSGISPMKPPHDPYDRLTARRMSGEHCQFCGDTKASLVKMRCCDAWSCCDKAWLSDGGGNACRTVGGLQGRQEGLDAE
jgi:hypothetical protein